MKRKPAKPAKPSAPVPFDPTELLGGDEARRALEEQIVERYVRNRRIGPVEVVHVHRLVTPPRAR